MLDDHLTHCCSLRRKCSSHNLLAEQTELYTTDYRQLQIRQDHLQHQRDRYQLQTEQYCYRMKIAESRHQQFRNRILQKLTDLEQKIDAMLLRTYQAQFAEREPDLWQGLNEIFDWSSSTSLHVLEQEINYMQQELARQDRLIIAAVGFLMLITVFLFRK